MDSFEDTHDFSRHASSSSSRSVISMSTGNTASHRRTPPGFSSSVVSNSFMPYTNRYGDGLVEQSDIQRPMVLTPTDQYGDGLDVAQDNNQRTMVLDALANLQLRDLAQSCNEYQGNITSQHQDSVAQYAGDMTPSPNPHRVNFTNNNGQDQQFSSEYQGNITGQCQEYNVAQYAGDMFPSPNPYRVNFTNNSGGIRAWGAEGPYMRRSVSAGMIQSTRLLANEETTMKNVPRNGVIHPCKKSSDWLNESEVVPYVNNDIGLMNGSPTMKRSDSIIGDHISYLNRTSSHDQTLYSSGNEPYRELLPSNPFMQNQEHSSGPLQRSSSYQLFQQSPCTKVDNSWGSHFTDPVCMPRLVEDTQDAQLFDCQNSSQLLACIEQQRLRLQELEEIYVQWLNEHHANAGCACRFYGPAMSTGPCDHNAFPDLHGSYRTSEVSMETHQVNRLGTLGSALHNQRSQSDGNLHLLGSSPRKAGTKCTLAGIKESTPFLPAPQAPLCLESTRKAHVVQQYYDRFKSLDDIKGQIFDSAMDQQGCRFLQKKITEGKPEDVETILQEIIKGDLVELTMDSFGNYLVQKLLEVCNSAQFIDILRAITKQDDLVTIAMNVHGTRVVQKVVERLHNHDQISMVVSSLRQGIVTLIKDPSGNHVVQRCLHHLSNADCKFIFDAATSHCEEIATHRYGCCVLQRCLDFAEEAQRRNLIEKITATALMLSQDPYGNYVVQYVLDLNLPWASMEIISRLKGTFSQLATQKCSSNVVEKCLKVSSDESLECIVRELMATSVLGQLLQDPYANYVIQSALEATKGSLHTDMLDAIKPYLHVLRSNPYGKRILSCCHSTN